MTTIDTPIVVTAIPDGNPALHADTSEDTHTLIERVLAIDTEQRRTTLVCAWDRPARSQHDEGGSLYPDSYLRVASHPPTGWGALWWVGEHHGRPSLLVTHDPTGPHDRPELTFDIDADEFFPTTAALPLEAVRRALHDYISTAQLPTRVGWQPTMMLL
ncbi:Imm1 family immunity protein [Actinopolyspora mortivallis]|uniref:Immunity protein Imm1 n=1 Tax=Actinopolyspora mortivallis TaxID=33906 RepID=A0A2T0GSK0_ACTMO|nr:Imm1 family immunity protein [Actinopolyspora mortivallis]PRW62098.1 hypothetical protein CEP50_17340 [Actinopolyspora mortivallis]